LPSRLAPLPHQFHRRNFEPAADKDYIVVDGGALGYTGFRDCGVPAENFSNTLTNNFDYVPKWANARF